MSSSQFHKVVAIVLAIVPVLPTGTRKVNLWILSVGAEL